MRDLKLHYMFFFLGKADNVAVEICNLLKQVLVAYYCTAEAGIFSYAEDGKEYDACPDAESEYE